MTTAFLTVAAALLGTLDGIEVAPDGCRAAVAGETLEADSPRRLARELTTVLYETLHVGRDKAETTRPRTLRDSHFDRLLADAMPHTTTLTRALVHRRIQEDDYLASLDGVRVILPATALTGPALAALPAEVPVRIPAARPALSTGFFLADGSAGTGIGPGPHLLRVYIHLTGSDIAGATWRAVLSRLEKHRLPYRAKVVSATRLFPRRDALVVYLGARSWEAVPDIVSCVAGSAGVTADTSPFAHQIAPGVAVAWEPQDQRPGMRGLSFGEHRAAVLAEAVVRHAVRTDGVGRHATVAEAFLDAGIDPQEPARNLTSPAWTAIGLG